MIQDTQTYKQKYYIRSGTEKRLVLAKDISDAIDLFFNHIVKKVDFEPVSLSTSIRISQKGFDYSISDILDMTGDIQIFDTEPIINSLGINDKFTKQQYNQI